MTDTETKAALPAEIVDVCQALPALVPSNMEQAITLAKFMSQGDLLPKHFQGSPANCLLVVEQALRWGMSPFAVASKTFVVNGTLGYEAQLVAAVVYRHAPLEGRLKIEWAGDDEKRTCTVTGIVAGTECAKTSPEIGAITTKNSPLWKVDPDQQLAYWTTRAWARLYVPEVLLGTYTKEELEASHIGPNHARNVTPETDLTPAPPRPTRSEPQDTDDVQQRAIDIADRDGVSLEDALTRAREEAEALVTDVEEEEADKAEPATEVGDIPKHLQRNPDNSLKHPPTEKQPDEDGDDLDKPNETDDLARLLDEMPAATAPAVEPTPFEVREGEPVNDTYRRWWKNFYDLLEACASVPEHDARMVADSKIYSEYLDKLRIEGRPKVETAIANLRAALVERVAAE